jgi:hypothetical protein
MKLLEESTGGMPQEIGTVKDILGPKSTGNKSKNKQMEFLQTKNILHRTGNSQRNVKMTYQSGRSHEQTTGLTRG